MLASNTRKRGSLHSLKKIPPKENIVRNKHSLEVQFSPRVHLFAKIKIAQYSKKEI